MRNNEGSTRRRSTWRLGGEDAGRRFWSTVGEARGLGGDRFLFRFFFLFQFSLFRCGVLGGLFQCRLLSHLLAVVIVHDPGDVGAGLASWRAPPRRRARPRARRLGGLA